MEKPLFAAWLGSAVVLLQTALNREPGFFWIYALTISALGTTLCTILLLLEFANKTRTMYLQWLALLLVATWICGAGVMTTSAPFVKVGNGYFGTWCALGSAVLILVDYGSTWTGSWLKSIAGRQGAMVHIALTFSSVAVLVQSIVVVAKDRATFLRAPGWSLVCSAVGAAISVSLHVPYMHAKSQPHTKSIATFLLAWWTAGISVATFVGPYVTVGNGFFGCWVAFAAAVTLFDMAWGWPVSTRVRSISTRAHPELLVMCIASVIVLISTLSWGRFGDVRFWVALICSTVTCAACVALIASLLRGNCGLVVDYIFSVSLVLLIWWILGAGFMTFGGPFVDVGNGFIGAWIATISAALLCEFYSENIRCMVQCVGDHAPCFIVLALASLVLLIQVIVDATSKAGVANLWFAGVCSVVTLLMTCVGVASKCSRFRVPWSDGRILLNFACYALLPLTLLWCAGVGVLTFGAPYTYAGNAYFACWSALAVCALWMWRLVWPAADDTTEVGREPGRDEANNSATVQDMQTHPEELLTPAAHDFETARAGDREPQVVLPQSAPYTNGDGPAQDDAVAFAAQVQRADVETLEGGEQLVVVQNAHGDTEEHIQLPYTGIAPQVALPADGPAEVAVGRQELPPAVIQVLPTGGQVDAASSRQEPLSEEVVEVHPAHGPVEIPGTTHERFPEIDIHVPQPPMDKALESNNFSQQEAVVQLLPLAAAPETGQASQILLPGIGTRVPPSAANVEDPALPALGIVEVHEPTASATIENQETSEPSHQSRNNQLPQVAAVENDETTEPSQCAVEAQVLADATTEARETNQVSQPVCATQVPCSVPEAGATEIGKPSSSAESAGEVGSPPREQL